MAPTQPPEAPLSMPTAEPEKQYPTPLVLTTPHMQGRAVRDAQWLMAGNNRFDGLATYKDAAIDGDYGPLTAQATARAKYWVGYPSTACTPVFGQTLYEYLRPNEWRPLPLDYRTRRAARLKAAQRTTGQKALEQAITQLGVEESPRGSNWQKYGAWYGMNGVPWCCIFDSWSFTFSGYLGFRYAYVPSVLMDATLGRNRLRIVRTPAPGDLALHTVHGVRAAHISFFEKWISQTDGVFYDVGGNTGPSDISNGGAVMRQRRYTTNMTAFVRVN